MIMKIISAFQQDDHADAALDVLALEAYLQMKAKNLSNCQNRKHRISSFKGPSKI